MPGKYQYEIELKSNVAKLLTDMKEVQDRLDTVEGKEYKIKLNIDEKKLSNVISNLEKMLDSLGKGTGDFKQFENLSKELSSIATDINNISKAFSVMNDGSDFANIIKSIDASLTALSNHFVSEMSGRMTSSIKEVKSTLSDIGDGGELAPLLQIINKIENAINELSASIKGIGLNMNIDIGSDSEMEAKVQSKIANALQAYQRLFDHIKMSSAGGSVVNNAFFEFDINQYDTMMGKLQAYKKFIENMRNEAKVQYNGKDVLYQNTEKSYWTQASAAMAQVTKAFNEMNTASNTNPLTDMFGKTDLSEVVSQLGLIVTKLEEISTTASSFKNVFDNGFNVTASVEEIDKLTNRVKELEDELSKIKSNPVSVDKSNISSGAEIKDVFQGDDKVNTDASTTSIKEESQALEQVSTSAKDAASSKEKFAKANKEVKASADSSKTSISEEEKYFNSLGKSLTQYQNTLTSISRKPSDGNRSQELQEKIDIISSSLEKLNALKSKTEEDGYVFNKDDVDTGKQLEEIIKKNIELVKQMSSAQKGSDALSRDKEIDTITKYLNKFTGISKQAKQELKGLLDQLQSDDPSVNVKKIHERFLELTVAERNAGREARNLFDIFKDKKIYSFLGQAASMFSFYDLISLGREIVTNIKEVDTALTELRKVSDATEQRLTTNFKNSADTAKELGATISDVISATADWSRMGYNIDQAEELARISTLYRNVGDGIDIETANNSLISTLQGFQLDASEAESIIDKFNEVANNYAIDSAGIGEALQRSAASFNAANTDLSKSIALITATNEVVQDPDSVGTLWKTMSARIRGAETELSELNEETDEYTKTTSKLRDLVMSLTGFDIMEDEDTFKDIYEIILGIGQEWQNLTDAEQASLGEALAGKRNANALYAVLGNLETLQSAYETAENSAGSAMREQENYEKSIQYSLDRLSASVQEWSNALVSSDVIKWFVDLANAAVELPTTLTPLGTLALGGGIFAGIKNIGRPKMFGLYKYADINMCSLGY